jgi:hypothetical protein
VPPERARALAERATTLLTRSQDVAALAHDNVHRTRQHVAEIRKTLAGARPETADEPAGASDRPDACEVLAAFEQRSIARLPRRGSERATTLLEAVAALDRQVKRRLQELVDACREDGATWGEIGAALQVSRQAAHERFTRARLHEKEEAARPESTG